MPDDERQGDAPDPQIDAVADKRTIRTRLQQVAGSKETS